MFLHGLLQFGYNMKNSTLFKCECILAQKVLKIKGHFFPMSRFKGAHHSHLNHAWDHCTFSGKLPTYPSPKPTACPKWDLSYNVDLGEGRVVRTYHSLGQRATDLSNHSTCKGSCLLCDVFSPGHVFPNVCNEIYLI